MFITFKTVLNALLVPPAGTLLLAAAGIALIGLRRGTATRRTGWALLIAGLGILWLLATPAVANRLAHAAQRCPPLDLSRGVEAQAIVILGGSEARPDAAEYAGAPAAAAGLLGRVTYGAFLAQRTGLPVLVTGTVDETRSMSGSLERDLHVTVRWVEDRSRDTFQNAEFSAPLLKAAGVSRILLVTDAQHEWRAVHEFESAGLIVVPAPEGAWMWHGHGPRRYVPNTMALENSNAALHELISDLVRRALAALDLRRQSP
jgi:uncharacterized SAM-binding protein YcdF (DUF218 family)